MDCPSCKEKGKLETRICPACKGISYTPEVKNKKKNL